MFMFFGESDQAKQHHHDVILHAMSEGGSPGLGRVSPGPKGGLRKESIGPGKQW